MFSISALDKSIANNDKLNPLVPGSLVNRCRDTEYTLVWILATNNRAADDGSDVYTSFTQLVSHGRTWAPWAGNVRKRGGFMQITSCDDDVTGTESKPRDNLRKTLSFSFILSEWQHFKQNISEIMEQLQERFETVWLERCAINALLSSTDPQPNSVIEAKTYTEWGLFI